jgi:RNA polymerase sigma factor (sigma-70 family)
LDPAHSVSLPIDDVRRVLGRAVRRLAPAWLESEYDDLVQSALLRLVRQASTEEWRLRGTSYLWKVAHSVVMDEIRSRRRRRETALDSESGTEQALARAPQEGRELGAAISAGLRELAAPRREAVLLYLLGYSLEESARVLGRTTKQVDNHRYRGLKDLRHHLDVRGYRP